MRTFIAMLTASLFLSAAAPAHAASEQDLAAWFEQGYRADAGDGVKQDDAVAFEWYLKAAEGGHVAAMRNLAGMFGSGRGTTEDQEAAGRWFKAAAEGGDAQGQYAYGNWYVQNPAEKIDWLRKAAQQGHKEAIALLGETNVEVGKPTVGEAPLLPRLAAVCVQEQLKASGYDVGGIDGDIGGRSIAAAKPYAADNGMSEAGLTRDDAERWCRMLAERDAKLSAFLTAAVEEMDRQDAAYGPAEDFRYLVEGPVPENELDLIRTGIQRAESYLAANLGGGIPEDVRKSITVKIVATGRGNEELGGGGAAATAFAEATPRPFFDVRHPQWNQDTRGRG